MPLTNRLWSAFLAVSTAWPTDANALAPAISGDNVGTDNLLNNSIISGHKANYGSVLPFLQRSTGGGSQCIVGNVKVTVTSQNFAIDLPEPEDQLAATELVLERLQANSDLAARVVGAPRPVTGTYSIYSSLCFPADPEAARKMETVQFLTHGDTVSSTYWDIAPGYSYVDAVTEAGHAAFSYDRIGVGRSDHPDPVQVVQGPLQVEIAHALVTLLRKQHFGPHKFKKVVGVGHSAGSTVTQGVTTTYPEDFDAVILTGISTLATYVPLGVAALDLQIASQASSVFEGLPNGYLTQANAIGIQFTFFRYPNFDRRIFDIVVQEKQTNTIGQLLTLGSIVTPSPGFTGPIDVVLGENDLIFCGGDCSTPVDQSAAVQPAFYPSAAAGSEHFLLPGAGHVINAHLNARASWDHQLAFLDANGL